MNTASTVLPIPLNPRHQRFADAVCAGETLTAAYLKAGFKCSRATAQANAKKLRRRHDVVRYIRAMQSQMAEATLLSIREILEFCARIVRTPITKLDPNNEQNADLIKSYSVNETEMGRSIRLEKHDPFKAIEIHLKLTNEDPETNALKDLAAAIGALGAKSPIPPDKM